MANHVNSQTLRAERERRNREREKLAASYSDAADVLDVLGGHRDAVALLRREAETWRRSRER